MKMNLEKKKIKQKHVIKKKNKITHKDEKIEIRRIIQKKIGMKVLNQKMISLDMKIFCFILFNSKLL